MFPSHELYDKDYYMKGIVEFGKITTVDPDNANATVTFPDRNYQSGPLKWIHRSCLGAQHYDMPTIGDTAIVLHSGTHRERGVILGFVYTNGNPPPWTAKSSSGKTGDSGHPPETTGHRGTWRGILFSDNSYIVYDQGGSNYILNLQGKITLTTVGDVTNTLGKNLIESVAQNWNIGVQQAINIRSYGANCTINGVIIDPSGNMYIPGALMVEGQVTFNSGGTASPSIINTDGSGAGS